MSVTLSYSSKISVSETLETNVPAATDKGVTHTGYDTTATLNATSTPAATKFAAFEKALSTGTATIDLTALVGTNGAAVDGSGLRVQAIKFRNKSTNANVMTLSKGASNGYDGLGASASITLSPGGEVLLLLKGAGAVIGGTNKNLDLAGTLTQVAEIGIILG